MTDRKPPNVSFERWVDQQVREAQARGAFDDLPGAGQPIADIDRPPQPNEWIAKLARREQIDPALFLPPSLTLPRELEELRDRLRRESSEDAVRATVLDLNQRIREAHRRPQVGPPLLVMSVDVEQVVACWRDDREELRRQYDAAHPPARPAEPAARGGRRWRPARAWWTRGIRARPSPRADGHGSSSPGAT